MVKVKIEPACSTGRRSRRPGRRLQQRRGVHRQLHREGDPAAQDRGGRGPGLGPASRPGIHRMTHVLAQIAAWLSAAANALGAVPARPGRRLAGLALGHGRRGGDGRAVARRLQVHLQPARDQARPQRHQRQPAGPEAVQGQRAGVAAGAGADPRGRVPAVRPRHRADAGHGRAGDPAPGPARPLVPGRPLRVGEDAVITLKLDGDAGPAWPAVSLRAHRRRRGHGRAGPRAEQAGGLLERQGPRARQPPPGVPGRRPDHRQGARDRRRLHAGQHERPGWDWSAILLNPGEEPFRPDDPVRSIEIDYPQRDRRGPAAPTRG